MDNQTQIIFTSEDFANFRNWLKLNMESVTWQGRFQAEFEKFWSVFFTNDTSFSVIIERFDYSCEILRVGPLISWFNWLKEKFICFSFIEKDLSILEISKLSANRPSNIAVILRNFFVDLAPHQEEYFSEVFQIGNVGSKNLELRFSEIQQEVSFDSFELGAVIDEIMPSLEVTLYEDWSSFVNRIEKDFSKESKSLTKIKSSENLVRRAKVFQDAVILLVIAIAGIWLVISANDMYEKHLSDKISIYEPQFKWLNRSLVFKGKDNVEVSNENFSLDITDIENVDDTENFLGESLDESDRERTGVESEVVLTSWDSLPKDFDVADLELSDYEEIKKRGYRDTRYGHTKVYRVMLRSSDTSKTRNTLTQLLDKYKVTQVDNVKPGLDVPGGLYYNLYVPRLHLKEFMAQVLESDEGVIYESRTRTGRNPPGKNKVFIWIKKF